MCGILVLASPEVDTLNECSILEQALLKMSHRGPDNQSYQCLDQNVFLGHTRLSILDSKSNSNMPMSDPSNRYWIVFNGQIYNYRKLRTLLKKKGHIFKTSSDTEVLLNAYINWGNDCLQHIEGMFAFVIYDSIEQSCFVARDPLGIKPLYYYSSKDFILFASEIKAIKTIVGELSVSKYGLFEYLICQNQLGSETLFENVKLFPKGHFSTVKSKEKILQFNQFWSPEITPRDGCLNDFKEEFEDHFKASISTHLHADCDVNSFLSGGLDSAAIALYAKRNGTDLLTLTCGFENRFSKTSNVFIDERNVASELSASLSLPNSQIEISPYAMLDELDKWAYYCEEPRAGSTFPNYKISEKASHFSKVCLSGTGGDELFAGYPWRYKDALQLNDKEFFQIFLEKHLAKLFSMSEVEGLTEFGSNFGSVFLNKAETKYNSYCNRNFSNGMARNINTLLLYDIDVFLEGLLIVDDKASMAHGLEVRYPFLDKNIVDFALRLPIENKLRISGLGLHNGNVRSTDGKVFLREVLSRHLPREICEADKQGFTPPFDIWYRNEFKEYILDDVLATDKILAGYIDISKARDVYAEFLKGKSELRGKIWSFIALNAHIKAMTGN